MSAPSTTALFRFGSASRSTVHSVYSLSAEPPKPARSENGSGIFEISQIFDMTSSDIMPPRPTAFRSAASRFAVAISSPQQCFDRAQHIAFFGLMLGGLIYVLPWWLARRRLVPGWRLILFLRLHP